ncbi:MAG: hypothetical protein KDA60_05075, partial [Planctomycetales bacterium]|nr:hypothetical protein [Planctomycetales bacterium]
MATQRDSEPSFGDAPNRHESQPGEFPADCTQSRPIETDVDDESASEAEDDVLKLLERVRLHAPEILEDVLGRVSTYKTMASTNREAQIDEDTVAVVAGQPVRIGRFEILEQIGSGGNGVVFRARDVRLKRLVALKIPRPEALISERLRERFIREAEAAAA